MPLEFVLPSPRNTLGRGAARRRVPSCKAGHRQDPDEEAGLELLLLQGLKQFPILFWGSLKLDIV